MTAYLNGHHFAGERLRQAGVALYQQDNAILRVADPVALQAAAAALTPAVLQARCDYWAAKLALAKSTIRSGCVRTFESTLRDQ